MAQRQARRSSRHGALARGWTSVAFAVALAAGGSSACMLVLDWEPEGLPCQSDGSCGDGYSCLSQSQTCVKDGSTSRIEPCTLDQQCASGLKCVGFLCREPCPKYFESGGQDPCDLDEFCKPFAAPGLVPPWRGYCSPTECGADADCVDARDGTACVSVKPGASACFSDCEPKFAGGVYGDSCQGLTPKYCQDLGRAGFEQFVCLDAGGLPTGAPCSLINNACARGATCYQSVCMKYCNPASTSDPVNCQAGELCCSVERGAVSFGVCATTCD